MRLWTAIEIEELAKVAKSYGISRLKIGALELELRAEIPKLTIEQEKLAKAFEVTDDQIATNPYAGLPGYEVKDGN